MAVAQDVPGGGIHGARAALAAGKSALVWRRQIADTDTPISAALKLFEPDRGDFLLESVEGGVVRGRYSLIGLAPDLVFRAQGEKAEINRHWATDRDAFVAEPVGALDALRALVAECRADLDPALPAALACLVGYFGYETVGLVERLPRAPQSELMLPDMLFVRPTTILVFDNLSDELFCIAPLWADGTDPERAIEDAGERIDSALRTLGGAIPAAERSVELPELALTPVMPDGQYREMVLRAKDYIAAGDIFQVVPSQRFSAPFARDSFAFYRSLRRTNPSPFLFHMNFGDFQLAGSSPEILVRLRDGELTIRPLAGTRPRGKTPEEDQALEAELLADPKELAEHLMLVDLGRNDVGRVAEPASVKVTKSFFVERYSHVMHLVSNVTGKARPDLHPVDILLAALPAGTLSGAPKVRAMEIIDELETVKRGVGYAGAAGYISSGGEIDACIVLRTALFKDGVMHVQAGAGVVADSDPKAEYEETLHKSRALKAAAEEAWRFG